MKFAIFTTGVIQFYFVDVGAGSICRDRLVLINQEPLPRTMARICHQEKVIIAKCEEI